MMKTLSASSDGGLRTRKRAILPNVPRPEEIIDERHIEGLLSSARPPDAAEFHELLSCAKELHGLTHEQVARLLLLEEPDQVEEMGRVARWVKEEIYGRRLVFFVPLYLSNVCRNGCLYCAFRRQNTGVQRATLTTEEIRREVQACEQQGQKRLLLLVGEFGSRGQIVKYMEEAITTVYATTSGVGEIRRVNVNVPALDVDQFKRLKAMGIGTYQLFQETYRRSTFQKAHPAGPKANYAYHLTAMDRAQTGGIDDLGVGVLFGLDDYRFEVLALLMHAEHLDRTYGTGPHTISVPRINPAQGAPWAMNPPRPVNDAQFKKLVAVLRLAVPYTGMILTTRENPKLRREVMALGISQISAGSRTQPGGYAEGDEAELAQFSLGDHRSVDEVIREVCSLGYVPSFCTACYRRGRTGADFMDLAKPGLIKQYCLPNALATFAEYLQDYASPATKEVGWKTVDEHISQITSQGLRRRAQSMVHEVRSGQRDVLV
jgi:2-iminoacetate synthase